MEPMLPEEALVYGWLKGRHITFDFHSTLLGNNPAVNAPVPFTLPEQETAIGFVEDTTQWDAALVRLHGFDLFTVTKETPIADLEGRI